MATGFKACSVDACNGNAHWTASGARGMCKKHWARFVRNGDPLVARTSPGTLERHLREVVFNYEGDECLIWPYSRNGRGYAVMRFEGRAQFVSRILCRLAHGDPPDESYMAAHSCGKGNLGCVTRRHLRWATALENSADRVSHGTAPRGSGHKLSKLTESDVREIRSLGGLMTQSKIAERFGITQVGVSQILLRKSWAWLAD